MMLNLSYGALLGIWVSAAVVEVRERKGKSASLPLRLLMAASALLTFVLYVANNR